jgi:conjugal transfer mating pair stabilization protein TraN
MLGRVSGYVAIAMLLLIAPAWAQQQICAVDLDGDGDADSQNEQGACTAYPTGQLCPLQSAACTTTGGTPPAIANATAAGTILNDDGTSGGPFSVESLVVNEPTGSNTTVSVHVTFPAESVGRDIQIQGTAITATAGFDYNMPLGAWLAPGATRMTFSVEIVGDADPESLESFRITVWDDANPIGTQSWGEIRIADNDAPAPGPGISITPAFADEGTAATGSLLFLVTMSAASADAVTVDFQTSGGTAMAGSDYTDVAGTLRFEPGVLAQTISVPLLPDGVAELDETFTVTLSNAASSTPPVCPLNPARPCHGDGTGQSFCSLQDCFLRSNVGGVITEPPDDPPEEGPRDALGNCLGALRIFSGTAGRCRMAGTQTHFSNCCSHEGDPMDDTMGAEGESSQSESVFENISNAITGIFNERCDERDKKTALLKESGYCILIDDYCSEEWPLVGCVQRAEAHCCFNSMLARIINEQGRPQIPSMGDFGTPQEPNCRGFSPEEFQALDFSKIDLSEYFAEIRTKNQSLIEGQIRPRIESQLRGGQ